MPKNANTRTDRKVVSYWGDCTVLRLQGGKRIEVIRPDGREITAETNKRHSNASKPEKFEQIELFSTDDNGTFAKYVDLNLLMSADYWTKGQG